MEYCNCHQSMLQILKRSFAFMASTLEAKAHLTKCKNIKKPISMRELLWINLMVSKEILVESTMKNSKKITHKEDGEKLYCGNEDHKCVNFEKRRKIMLSKFNIIGTSENNTELLTVRVKDDVRMVSQDHIN